MTYCVGSVERTYVGLNGSRPAGTLHAVRVKDAFEGRALCGESVQAWPGMRFPMPDHEDHCATCGAGTLPRPGVL